MRRKRSTSSRPTPMMRRGCNVAWRVSAAVVRPFYAARTGGAAAEKGRTTAALTRHATLHPRRIIGVGLLDVLRFRLMLLRHDIARRRELAAEQGEGEVVAVEL